MQLNRCPQGMVPETLSAAKCCHHGTRDANPADWVVQPSLSPQRSRWTGDRISPPLPLDGHSATMPGRFSRNVTSP